MNISKEPVEKIKAIITCQMLIIGPYRNRIENMLSNFLDEGDMPENIRHEYNTSKNNIVVTFEKERLQWQLELLPCVATFDQYYDASSKSKVPYLKSIQYFHSRSKGKDFQAEEFFSLATFFDTTSDETVLGCSSSSSATNHHWGIIAAAAGFGIQKEEHVKMIQNFVNTMLCTDNKGENKINVATVPKSKDLKTSNGSDRIGAPKVMAQFILEEAQTQMEQKLLSSKLAVTLLKEEPNQGDEIAITQPPTSPTAANYIVAQENTTSIIDTFCFLDSSNSPKEDTTTNDEPSIPTIKYACKICRCILFCQNDLENPPHEKGRMKKDYSNKFTTRSCESMFLAKPIFTMNNDNVGKLNCPKCSAKIGSWNWSGAQCSCGSWVTPAIQILSSRVDAIHPTSLV